MKWCCTELKESALWISTNKDSHFDDNKKDPFYKYLEEICILSVKKLHRDSRIKQFYRNYPSPLEIICSLLDSVGEGEGGMIWENGIETYIIPYIKWITSPGSMHDTGCLGLVHWDDPEGWYGKVEGGGFRMESTCTPMADSWWCMAKPIQYCN